jgi:NAD(P)H-dependent FMN reductase
MLPHISIISASVRTGRNSHRAALYFQEYLTERKLAEAEILDLKAYNFPIFEDKLKAQKDPSIQVLDFADKIKKSDGIIIVTPEYNGGYPASLKNAVDLLYEEWHGKPISICTASAGDFGGSQVLVQLQSILWKIGAWTVTSVFPIPRVQKAFEENGAPADKAPTDKLTHVFLKKLLESVAVNKKPEA